MGIERRVVHAQLDGTPRSVAVSALVGAGIGVEAVAARHQLGEGFLQRVGEGGIELARSGPHPASGRGGPWGGGGGVVRRVGGGGTVVTLGFLAVLPALLWLAFTIGQDDRNRGGATTLIDLATAGGPNFVVFTLFSATSFLLVVVVALFF